MNFGKCILVFVAAALALFGVASGSAYAAAAYDQPFATASAIPCNTDQTCALLKNIRVQAITFSAQLGSGFYQWAPSCPSTPDSVVYIRPTGATAGCFAMQGFASTVAPLAVSGSSGQIQTNNGSGALGAISIGTGAGTVAAGNDSRITGAAQTSANLGDLANAATARGNLGLGGAATKNVGTTTGTVAAGDDSRITGAAQQAGNNSFTGTNSHTGAETFSDIAQAQNVLFNRNNPVATYSANCGDAVSSEGAQSPGFYIVLTLPQNPNPDCTVLLFNHRLFSFYVLPNPIGTTSTLGANYIKTGQFDVTGTPLYIPGGWAHSSYILRFAPGGLSWVFDGAPPPPSSLWRINMHNGGVRFDHDPSNPQTRLMPNGDGGLVIHRMLFYIPPTGVPLPDSAVTALGASTFQYIYAVRQNDNLVTATCAGANNVGCPCPDIGKMCLTVTTTLGFYSGTPLTAVNFFGTPWTSPATPGANVTDDPNTILVNSNTIELSDVTYVAPEINYGNKVQPFVAYVGLVPDTAAPVLDPIDEVMVNPDFTGKTLVGAVYIDANGAVVDSPCERNVASYYNPMPKQMQCVLATSTSLAAFSTYHTPAAPLYGTFVAFPPPNIGNRASVSVPWSLSMVGNASVTGAVVGAGALFDIVTRAGGSNCQTSGVVDAPDGEVIAPASANFYVSASGTSTVPVGGRENFLYLCAQASSGTVAIKGTADTGTPGGTVLSATLMQ